MTTTSKPKAAPAPAVEDKPITEVVHAETVIVDNTEVEEVVAAPPEEEEADIGNGTVKVTYL